MTTKPKLKKIPLPKGLPKLPYGAVYLGQGPLNTNAKTFKGWSCHREDTRKDWFADNKYTGTTDLDYAAPADSAIAREILGEPAKPVTKRKAAKETITKPSKTITKSAKSKKTITLRKLPKNVPQNLPPAPDGHKWEYSGKNSNVPVDVSCALLEMYGVRKWQILKNYSHHNTHYCVPVPVKKPRVQRSKRLAPAKPAAKKVNAARREARKTQKIGVMPAPKPRTPAIAPLAEKFGVDFVKSAMTQGIALPDWLPALPPVPAGYDRWEPRGFGWSTFDCPAYAYCPTRTTSWVEREAGKQSPEGKIESFYIEAVRDEKPEAATDNASVHIELHQKEIERVGSGFACTKEVIEAYRAARKDEETRRNSAVGLLTEAAETIGARAAERDVESERSMAKCVAAFNVFFADAVTKNGGKLTEEQGWRFMELLKLSRSTVGQKRDDYLDGAAYACLAGESALNQEKP